MNLTTTNVKAKALVFTSFWNADMTGFRFAKSNPNQSFGWRVDEIPNQSNEYVVKVWPNDEHHTIGEDLWLCTDESKEQAGEVRL